MILTVEVYAVDLEEMKREIETLVVAKGLSEETVARARLRIRLPKRQRVILQKTKIGTTAIKTKQSQ